MYSALYSTVQGPKLRALGAVETVYSTFPGIPQMYFSKLCQAPRMLFFRPLSRPDDDRGQ